MDHFLYQRFLQHISSIGLFLGIDQEGLGRGAQSLEYMVGIFIRCQRSLPRSWSWILSREKNEDLRESLLHLPKCLQNKVRSRLKIRLQNQQKLSMQSRQIQPKLTVVRIGILPPLWKAFCPTICWLGSLLKQLIQDFLPRESQHKSPCKPTHFKWAK